MKKIIFIFVGLLMGTLFIYYCGTENPTATSPAPSPGDTSPSSSVLDDAIEEVVERLPTGAILFNPPREMVVGQTERVEVRIAKSFSDNFKKGLKGRGTPQLEEIMVGSRMDVQLEGEKFEIKKLSDSSQPVTSKGFTQWSWDIKPLKSGNQNLSLIVKVNLNIPDVPEQVNIPVLDKEIYVKVNPWFTIKSFLAKYWAIFFTALIAPLLIWWITGRRKGS